MIISFSPPSIACSTTAYADSIPNTTSLQKLLPKGFYVMTEAGAKAALKAKIDADANWALKTEAEKALLQANGTIVVLTIENHTLREVARVKTEEIKQLSWTLFKANLWKWGSVALNVFLAGKLARFY